MKRMKLMYNIPEEGETVAEAATRVAVALYHNYSIKQLWVAWDKCWKIYSMAEDKDSEDIYFLPLLWDLKQSIHDEIRRRYMMEFALMSDDEVKEYQKKEFDKHGESYEYYICTEELEERESYTGLFSETIDGGRAAYDEKVRKVCNLYGWDIVDEDEK